MKPRRLDIPGIDHPKVLSYVQVLQGAEVGRRVALIGAGGIGFDVAEFLTHVHRDEPDLEQFLAEWGIDGEHQSPGGLIAPRQPSAERHVFLLQRKKGKLGGGLGKTTGWIHRATLKQRGVEMLGEVAYVRIDDQGLHITVRGEPRVLEVDHVVVCAGQVSHAPLHEPLKAQGVSVHLIGGAALAAELDAKRAIRQGTELALSL